MNSRGRIIWFTGLSGAGKTAISKTLAENLRQDGEAVQVLDGDVMRQGLCANLGFSAEDRRENV